MPLQIKIVSDHKAKLGDNAMREFGPDGGTIGRSVKSDWTLPDPDNYVSGRHCTIDYQRGAYYLADISTNGVYANGEKKPIGKGNPRRLFDGDRLRMGDFEFVIALDEGEDLNIPMSDLVSELSVDLPDHGSEKVPEMVQKTGVQLLDEEEITGDNAFRTTLLGTGSKREKFKAEPGLSETQAVPLPKISRQVIPKDNSGELLEAFLKGLEIDRDSIDESIDLPQLMENAGNILREFVLGASDMLASRTQVKTMFKMEETMVLPQYNNPLKVAEDNRDALLQLLVGKKTDHLSPDEAVKQVCKDLKFHHDALLGAMTAAFLEFIDRFDPDVLQANFDGTLPKSFFTTLNRLRYWRMYNDLYPIMTHPGVGQFPHQFGESFVRSYAKHIADYKFMGGPDGDTMAIKSVKLLQQAFGELEDSAERPQVVQQAADRASG